MLLEATHEINTRPRKIHKWKSSAEKFNREILKL